MPPPLADAVHTLLATLKADLAARAISDAALQDERQAILRDWPRPFPPAAPAAPQLLPACRHLDATLAAAASGPANRIAAAIAPLLPALRWSYFYPVQPRWPDLASNIAFTSIIGPRGILDDDRINLGLTLLAPHTHYPLHSHPAIELYYVLAGTALWRVTGAAFTPRPPGALILHETNIGHAMQTEADPMLALYFWRGDLVTTPVYIDEA